VEYVNCETDVSCETKYPETETRRREALGGDRGEA